MQGLEREDRLITCDNEALARSLDSHPSTHVFVSKAFLDERLLPAGQVSAIEIACPYATSMKRIAQEDAWYSAWSHLRLFAFQVYRDWHKVDKTTKGNLGTFELDTVSGVEGSFGGTVGIDTWCDVVEKTPTANSPWPYVWGEPTMLHDCSGTFHHCPDGTFDPAVASGNARG